MTSKRESLSEGLLENSGWVHEEHLLVGRRGIQFLTLD